MHNSLGFNFYTTFWAVYLFFPLGSLTQVSYPVIYVVQATLHGLQTSLSRMHGVHLTLILNELVVQSSKTYFL